MAARPGEPAPVNAGATAERVYETLKHAIMNRAFRPGDRLDPAVIAEELNASTTPVREALNHLAGEGLVESRTGSGFHLPSFDEPGLKDMYAWSSELLALALRGWTRAEPNPAFESPETSDSKGTLAERTARLFASIAARSANGEHRRAVERLNARLHAVRSIEDLVVGNGEAEIETIEAAFETGDKPELRRRIGAYHRRRIRAAAAIVRALYRAE